MLMLLALAVPLALIGLIGGDDDEVETVDGTQGDDSIDGGAGNDLIRGLDGDDELTGGEGSDTIFGNDGEDILIGNNGADMLCAGEGDDVISGNGGQDTIEGQGGDDWVDGGYNNDGVFGNEGEDTLIGGRGMDRVNGGEGDDVVFGGIVRGVPLEDDEINDLADGESLADILGDKGLDIDLRDDDRVDNLAGGMGDDMIFIGNGDTALGDGGDDTFHLLLDDDNSDLTAEIRDYTPGEDNIVIVYDVPLEVTDVTVETSGEDAIITANGEELAVVTGGAGSITADDISIVTEDSIVSLFDPNGAAAPAA